MSTTTNHDVPTVVSVEDLLEARELVARALAHYADFLADADASASTSRDTSDDEIASEYSLLRQMAADVTGWTHTTRLRDFLRKAGA